MFAFVLFVGNMVNSRCTAILILFSSLYLFNEIGSRQKVQMGIKTKQEKQEQTMLN